MSISQMEEEEKPFVCNILECGMKFVNEDHFSVHKEKHELSLSFTPNSSFKTFYDQTPTPTRFLNAIESELFQELHDNPFDATFRQANTMGANTMPVPLPESSSLISSLPDTEPLSTPSITLNNETDLPLLRQRTGLSTISLKKPPVKTKEEPSKTPLHDSADTSAFESIKDESMTCDELIETENVNSEEKVPELSTTSSAAQTSVITSLSSAIKSNAESVSTVNVSASSATSVPNACVDQTSAKPSQPGMQAVSIAPFVQFIIRLPDGQSMPIQIPVMSIATPTLTTVTQPVKSVASISPKTSTITSTSTGTTPASSSFAKIKLKQVLTTQKTAIKSGTKRQCIMTDGSNTNPIIPSTSQVLNSDLSETPPSSPLTITQVTSAGRKSKEIFVDPDVKRKKSLERNRAAATRCRQKRKQWIQTLGKKADELAAINLHFQNEVALLRNEVAHLKTMLLAHKDCPVTQQQKASGIAEMIMPVTLPLNLNGEIQMDTLQKKSAEISQMRISDLMDVETSSSQSDNVSDNSEISTRDR